jgi:hypothetical protein
MAQIKRTIELGLNNVESGGIQSPGQYHDPDTRDHALAIAGIHSQWT